MSKCCNLCSYDVKHRPGTSLEGAHCSSSNFLTSPHNNYDSAWLQYLSREWMSAEFNGINTVLTQLCLTQIFSPGINPFKWANTRKISHTCISYAILSLGLFVIKYLNLIKQSKQACIFSIHLHGYIQDMHTQYI